MTEKISIDWSLGRCDVLVADGCIREFFRNINYANFLSVKLNVEIDINEEYREVNEARALDEAYNPTPTMVHQHLDDMRREVMSLYGGNLDHPALDHLEAAMVALQEADKEIKNRLEKGQDRT